MEFIIQNAYEVHETHEISIDSKGMNFLVIYGKHINGGYFAIPNWRVGGELASDFGDILWNGESIGKSLGNRILGDMIAKAIAQSASQLGTQGGLR